MTDWIFLSKNGQDEYVNMLAASAGTQPTDTNDFVYADNQNPIVLRGILKHKIMKQCWQDRRDFFYIDSGYFGNAVLKLWHRIVKNDLQHDTIVARPDDRLKRFGLTMPARRHGSKIVLALPDEKPCKFYGIDRDTWIAQTLASIRQYTDRPVVIRERAPKRVDRVSTDPLSAVLAQDVHALVTFNSAAGVESILQGVPAFVLAPTHAARPVANTDLSQIDQPYWPDTDKIHAWACHLAYGQFHVRELKDGTALRILNED